MYKNTKKAISFYELIIVLAIIGIITAITIPTMRNYLPSWQLSGSARVLVNQLRQAQEEAVTTQKQHRINFTSTTPPVSYDLVKVDYDDLGAEVLTTIETTTMPSNISIEFETITNPIAFSSDGGPSSSGNIRIILGEATKTVNVSVAGVIKLLQWENVHRSH